MGFEEWYREALGDNDLTMCDSELLELAYNAGMKSTCVRADCGVFSYEAGMNIAWKDDLAAKIKTETILKRDAYEEGMEAAAVIADEVDDLTAIAIRDAIPRTSQSGDTSKDDKSL